MLRLFTRSYQKKILSLSLQIKKSESTLVSYSHTPFIERIREHVNAVQIKVVNLIQPHNCITCLCCCLHDLAAKGYAHPINSQN